MGEVTPIGFVLDLNLYVFVVPDGLNKYAPREEYSPIQDILLDIAKTGE